MRRDEITQLLDLVTDVDIAKTSRCDLHDRIEQTVQPLRGETAHRGSEAEAPRHRQTRDARAHALGAQVAVVSTKELVTAVAGQHDIHGRRCETCGKKHRDLRGIGKRLVVEARHLRQHFERLRAGDIELGVVGREVPRDRAGVPCFVERLVLDADCERLDRPGAACLHQRNDGRGVEAAREQSPGRLRGLGLQPDRIDQQRFERRHGFPAIASPTRSEPVGGDVPAVSAPMGSRDP